MSIFSFPRYNFKGVVEVNVGTGNNDDYSSLAWFEDGPLRLANSIEVQPNYAAPDGMSDEEWVKWAQTAADFDTPPQADAAVAAAATPESTPERRRRRMLREAMSFAERVRTRRQDVDVAAAADGDDKYACIPAEWNYYGDMGWDFQGVTLTGVTTATSGGTGGTTAQTGAGLGETATLSFKNRADDTGRNTAMLIDVNPEDVPCSQVFADAMLLEQDGQALLSGRPSKAVTRWINFQRNTNLTGPNGAAGTFQIGVPLADLEDDPLLAQLPQTSPDGRALKGVIVRYVVFRCLQPINTFRYSATQVGDPWFEKMTELYATKGMNPDYGQVTATLAPWYEGEMDSVPTGRLLNPTGKTFPVPAGDTGNGTCFSLAPAVLQIDEQLKLVSIDLATSLPDQYQVNDDDPYNPTQLDNNPKYDFGELHLVVRDGNGQEYDFGAIPYKDTDAGDRCGWLFDFALPEGQEDLIRSGSFYLHAKLKDSTTEVDLLAEDEYMIASDQACIFADQGPAGSTTSAFLNDSGAEGPATVRVFQKGVEVAPGDYPMTVWEYDTTPNQNPGKRKQLTTGYQSGQPLTVDTSAPGNRLYTFTGPGDPPPPEDYGDLNLATEPMTNLRLLPLDDYSQYYEDPSAAEPIGNDQLTWEVIYAKVLRNYYLLYPGMSLRIPLNDPDEWTDPQMAQRLLQRTQKAWFGESEYMPRTRDLSDSRRQLLAAWARKVIGGGQ